MFELLWSKETYKQLIRPKPANWNNIFLNSLGKTKNMNQHMAVYPTYITSRIFYCHFLLLA